MNVLTVEGPSMSLPRTTQFPTHFPQNKSETYHRQQSAPIKRPKGHETGMSPPPPPNKTQPNLGGNTIRRKRKLVSSGGQKWFKSSPRKSRPIHQTPSLPTVSIGLESPPPLPPMLVQFSFEGLPDLRLSVYDQILVISKDDDSEGSSHKKKKKAKDEEEEGTPKKPEEKPLPKPLFHELKSYPLVEAPPLPNAYIRWIEVSEELGEEVEYHIDEEDSAWLEFINKGRDGGGVQPEIMELLMDRLEKESYLQMQSSGLDQRPVIDDDAVCCICMDGECQNSNAILFCDMCNLAVHQECYGVPYIPEGQWLCRRCLQSPSREVDCVLCPNKGGAFKQTDDGRWVHVVCAIWIPEVCFANTVFLEPVDSVNNIPPARWRLCCFICKYKGRGACIQCHKSNCYIAFHVTCAQHAGLCMRMDTVRVGSTVTVRKTAYCDNHAPPDFIRSRDGDSPSVRQKLKACRKMLAEKRSAKPTVSVPTIPPERLNEIGSNISFSRKNQFIKRLLSYWKLKRIQRNGVPLLRRLQAASNHPPSAPHHQPHQHLNVPPSQNDHAWKFLMRLRQDLERARLLCELIRKREKTKRELVAIRTNEWIYKTTPFVQFQLSIIDELGSKDPQGIFADPVDPEAVPDYLSVISTPMDLSTMRKRALMLDYDCLDEIQRDFQIMIDNCLLYNSKDTIFHRAALRLREVGEVIFREAERMEEQIGYDPFSGLHSTSAAYLDYNYTRSKTPSVDQICEEMDAFLNDDERHNLPYSQHIVKLQDLIDKVVTLDHALARKNRYRKLLREMQRIRRLENPPPQTLQTPKSSPRRETSPKRQVPQTPQSAGRKLRRKSVFEDIDEEKTDEEVRERPPKRRVVQEMEAKAASPSRRPSKSTENSPTHQPSTPNLKSNTTTPSRRTRSSVDSDRVTRTTTKTPMSNGLVRNGRNRTTSTRRKDSDPSPTSRSQPPIDSFSVYRDTEKDSSEGEEQDEDEEEENEEPVSDDESSSEESGSEAGDFTSADSSPTVSPRVTRGGRDQSYSRRNRRREESSSEEEENVEDGSDIQLGPRHLVWALLHGAWSPAMIVDPDAPPDKNGVTIPSPPEEILAKRPLSGRRRKDGFLILFFDRTSTWLWVNRDELQPLGVIPSIDKRRLEEGSKRKWVRPAYERATLQFNSKIN